MGNMGSFFPALFKAELLRQAEQLTQKAEQLKQEAERLEQEAENATRAAEGIVAQIRRQEEEERERTRAAEQLAAQIRQEAEEERERARVRQKEVDQAAVRASEEAQRMNAEMEEAAEAAKHAEELTREASTAAKEEAAKLAEEAQAERERSQKMREEAARAMAEMKEEAERVQRVADEHRRQAEAGKALAEETARTAAAEAQRAKEGIQPIVTPSPEQVAAAKRRIEYKENHFHFAVAGISGSGKSSLVNAFRGLRNRGAGAAAVGITETARQITRYADATGNPENPVVWYEIPGAGGIKCRDWQYFNDQGLYVFDCIIVLFDNRFTMTDVAILMNARRFDIPTYIVRSKADQYIRSIMEMEDDDSNGDDKDDERSNRLYKTARMQFIEQTRRSVKANLEGANLPDQRVYIVSNKTLLSIMRNKMPKNIIDEVELINDLGNEALARRKIVASSLRKDQNGAAVSSGAWY